MPRHIRMVTVAELASALGASFAGDGKLRVSGAAEPSQASPAEVALAMDPAFAETLAAGHAKVAILWPGADWASFGLGAAIFAPRPRYVLAAVTRVFEMPPAAALGVHANAVIDPTADIGEGASVGPFVVVGPGVRIGVGARILSHVSIGENARIGAEVLLHSGVRIGARVEIGDRFIAQPGAVIGADGFSYVTPTPGLVEEARSTGAVSSSDQGAYVRINSLGSVIVGDDVEIGANSCIDRGTIANTVIGSGTKIDNLVQIGHNVRIGETCLVCGQAGIAGSTVIGNRVVIGGAAKVADHLRVGSNVVITGNSGVNTHVADNMIMMGYPAVRMDLSVEMYKALRRLPRVLARLDRGQKQVPNPASSN